MKYIFGFSRGAYAARILSALIHVAGIPDLTEIEKSKRNSYIENIFDAYKSKKSIPERRKDVAEVLGYTPQSVDIEFLGIWDTVEALGIPDYEENWTLPNPRYADQLCNIKNAAHAVSIDDDRARIFTPILLTHEHLVESYCKDVNINNVVDEVWFSGSHSDVGGGYTDTHISGVSLNWMLRKIHQYQLVPIGSSVYGDFKGDTHDPESGVWGLIYRKRSRSLEDYARHTKYNNKKLKIHRSVFDRLEEISPKNHEYQWLQSDGFKGCFHPNGLGIKYIESKNCFTVVEY